MFQRCAIVMGSLLDAEQVERRLQLGPVRYADPAGAGKALLPGMRGRPVAGCLLITGDCKT
jgi:hypothetical protein